ncbi:hypothetical protein R1sor_004353 [Riccia sorocarpa]|uniref:Uncharacterized protein n=1 Tax=Riccia sorocarpa TaxID=122646 RepID=A0ABD3HJZ0_9MARC
MTLERQPPVPLTPNSKQGEDNDYDSKSILQDENKMQDGYSSPEFCIGWGLRSANPDVAQYILVILQDRFASTYELPPPPVEVVEEPKGPAAELSRQDLVFCCKPGVREALADVLTLAGKASRVPEELRKQDYLYTKAAFDFIRSNLAVSPPVFFGPKIFAELEKLNQAVSAAVPPKIPDPPQGQVPEVVIVEETDRSRRKSKKDKKAGASVEDSKKSKRKKSKPGEDTSPAPAVEAGDEAAEDSSKKKKGKKRSKDKAVEGQGEGEGRVEASSAAGGKKASSRRKSVRINAPEKSADAIPSEVESGAAASPPQPDASTSPIEVSPAAWAGSVSSILEAINTIPERAIRRQFRKQLSSLMETAAVPNHQTSLLLRAMYKSLHHISGDVENVLETVTEESGRPIVEKLLHTYYEQIEAEQAAAESVGASEAGADPEDLTWPFKDDDSDTDWLPEEEKNQVKRERANEMLAFLMKWIHILTEARCILRYGFDQAQDRISDEQASVAAMIDQKIAEYLQDSSEDACWKVFDLERKKQHLQEELVKLPPCQLPNCPNCPKPTEEPKVKDPDDDDSGLFVSRRGMSTLL